MHVVKRLMICTIRERNFKTGSVTNPLFLALSKILKFILHFVFQMMIAQFPGFFVSYLLSINGNHELTPLQPIRPRRSVLSTAIFVFDRVFPRFPVTAISSALSHTCDKFSRPRHFQACQYKARFVLAAC